MKPAWIPLIALGWSGLTAAEGLPPSYYDQGGAGEVPFAARQGGATAWPLAAERPLASGLAAAERNLVEAPARDVPDGEHASRANGDGLPPLPPTMDRAVRDLEQGMDELQLYTAQMARHIQRHGLRGFLAVPDNLVEQGEAVGRKLGNGINGIATDTGQQMVVPRKR